MYSWMDEISLHYTKNFLTLYLICQYWAQQQTNMIPKLWTNRVQLSEWVENIVGKGEIARYEQFLLFPQYFQKLSVVDASELVFME